MQNQLISSQVGFNSRTLGRVRLAVGGGEAVTHLVSIHAPWEGCDLMSATFSVKYSLFQFTHPGKGATGLTCNVVGDSLCFNSRTLGRVRRGAPRQVRDTYRGFNSRTLGRVRLALTPSACSLIRFQFTHPGKGATRELFDKAD